jgi:hypothetical protein
MRRHEGCPSRELESILITNKLPSFAQVCEYVHDLLASPLFLFPPSVYIYNNNIHVR